MTKQEFRDRCLELQRECGDVFPLWSLTEQAGVDALADPLTCTCFVLLDDGIATVPTSQGFDIVSGTPLVDRPEDYLNHSPEDVQPDLARALEAAVVHLVRVAQLSGRFDATTASAERGL